MAPVIRRRCSIEHDKRILIMTKSLDSHGRFRKQKDPAVELIGALWRGCGTLICFLLPLFEPNFYRSVFYDIDKESMKSTGLHIMCSLAIGGYMWETGKAFSFHLPFCEVLKDMFWRCITPSNALNKNKTKNTASKRYGKFNFSIFCHHYSSVVACMAMISLRYMPYAIWYGLTSLVS